MMAIVFLFLNLSSVFSNDSIGHKTIPYDNQKHIEAARKTGRYDLARYPMMNYVVDTSIVVKIALGDTIPADILDMPLWVVGKNAVSDNISLRKLMGNKLMILDFWATWCSPCVESMDKWESIQKEYPEDVVLVGVHMDYDFRAYPFVNEKGWNSLSIIGLNAFVLNSHFFNRRVLSKMVWIKEGRLIAITGTKGYDINLIKDVIAGEHVEIPMVLESTHPVTK